MGWRRCLHGTIAAISTLGLLLPNICNGDIPSPEEFANAVLSASGAAAKLQEAGAAATATVQSSSTDSAIWTAFLNAAAKNTQDGGIGQFVQSFQSLQDGDVSGIFNSANPGEQVDPSSIFTLDMGTNANLDAANIKNALQTAFGAKDAEDSVQNMQNPMWWAGQLYNLVSGSGSSSGIQTDCAWTATIAWDINNVSFPDQNSVYHVMYIPRFGPSDIVMIDGAFPDARYFSVQTYDSNFNPIDSARDLDLIPYNGLNPFASTTATKLTQGRYKIFLTKDGDLGYPNELALADGNYSDSSLGIFIFRLYGIDPVANTTNPSLRYWGYQPAPTVGVRALGGITPTGWDAQFTTLQQCPDANSEALASFVETLVEGRPQEDATTATILAQSGDLTYCQLENTKNGFMLQSRSNSYSARAPFINADANYLLACANNRPENIKNNDLIAVVQDYLPATPYSKFQARYVGDPTSYDVRYASLGVYDLKSPAPVFKTYADADFRNFYYNKYGSSSWEDNFGRNISMIVSTTAAALTRCNVDTSSSLTVALDSNGNTPPPWWGIIYRELIPQGSVINGSNNALYNLKAANVYKNSVWDASRVMCPKNSTGCDVNPYRVASIMQEHYPRISWYTCSPTGLLAVAAPTTHTSFDQGYTSLSTLPASQQYWYQFCPNATNSGLLQVYAPSTVTMHYQGQNGGSVPANTFGVYPFTFMNTDPSIVVGVSVKAFDPVDAYFMADVKVCGYSYISNPLWKCITHPPPDDSWLASNYDDSDWLPVIMIQENYAVPGMDPQAKWIGLPSPSVGTYCRLLIPNPTFAAVTATS